MLFCCSIPIVWRHSFVTNPSIDPFPVYNANRDCYGSLRFISRSISAFEKTGVELRGANCFGQEVKKNVYLMPLNVFSFFKRRWRL